jgi:hypothetical protein
MELIRLLQICFSGYDSHLMLQDQIIFDKSLNLMQYIYVVHVM